MHIIQNTPHNICNINYSFPLCYLHTTHHHYTQLLATVYWYSEELSSATPWCHHFWTDPITCPAFCPSWHLYHSPSSWEPLLDTSSSVHHSWSMQCPPAESKLTEMLTDTCQCNTVWTLLLTNVHKCNIQHYLWLGLQKPAMSAHLEKVHFLVIATAQHVWLLLSSSYIIQYKSTLFCNPCGFKDCRTILWTVVIYAGAVTVM